MKKYILPAILLSVSAAVAVNAQFPQAIKNRERMEEAATGKRKDANPNTPAPYRAKMNVDVQAVVAKQDVKTFAEAKPLAAKSVVDGDPLFLYVKFAGDMSRFVYKKMGDDGRSQNLIAVEVGAPGDMSTKYHYVLSFTDEELKASEIKIDLTKGIPGRNRSLPIFLRTASEAKLIAAPIEMRLTNRFGFPRGADENLAKLVITGDFSKGNAKYTAMLPQYYSEVIRGSADVNTLPLVGKYEDAGITARLTSELRDMGVDVEKMYFTSDDWLEFSEVPMLVMQQRTITAAFTYQRDGKCFYGIADITQPFEPVNAHYGASVFKITQDLARPCDAQ